MEQNIEQTINECIQLQDEIALLTPVILSLSPSLSMENLTPREIPKASREKFKEKLHRLLGLEKVKAEYGAQLQALNFKLSDLAEQLEEDGFEIERLRSRLPEDQYSWLLSHRGDLKKHLKGIDI
jgi:predicted RNase H-like nuclease (RuvC/YqgF family)